MSSDNLGKLDGVEIQQEEIIAELHAKQKVKAVTFSPDVKQFIIPAAKSYIEKKVRLRDSNCEYKRVIFSALYTATYVAFLTDYIALSNRASCRQYIPNFLTYLDSISINDSNRNAVLKAYETSRVKSDGVKTQSTGVRQIICLINISLNYAPFTQALSITQYSYLDTITKTKCAPPDSKDAKTLTSWFEFHSWLRRDDIGIGNELFNRTSSPKALTTSLRITSEVALCQIQEAKYALVDFFRLQNITPKKLLKYRPAPSINDYCKEDYDRESKEWKKYIYRFIEARFSFLQECYYKIESPSPELTLAFEMILHSWCKEKSVNNAVECFRKNSRVKYFFGVTTRFLVSTSALFSHEFLYELAEYEHLDDSISLPTCKIEHMLFQWLMSYQTVQASAIFKLTRSNFRFIKRVNGRITHIECDYFKGRSNDTHSLKSIRANTDMGQSILNFIDDRTSKGRDKLITLTYPQPALSTAQRGSLSLFIRLCKNSSINYNIETSLSKHNASPIFLNALFTIIENGSTHKVYDIKRKKRLSYEEWLLECDSPSKWNLFGLSTIKTSSVHGRSDNFRPTQLQNYNSHTNNVERRHYLTEHNREWLDSCGRITRAVMQDMQINVLAPSKSQIQSYNSDFTRAADLIDMKSSDIFNRLKLVSGRDNGVVNEIGLLSKRHYKQEDLYDTIFLLDSPETVMRFYHYINDVRKNHKLLSRNAKEYLFYTVLPTVEWMSLVLAERRFKEKNIRDGKALFHKYEKVLPSNFSMQLR